MRSVRRPNCSSGTSRWSRWPRWSAWPKNLSSPLGETFWLGCDRVPYYSKTVSILICRCSVSSCSSSGHSGQRCPRAFSDKMDVGGHPIWPDPYAVDVSGCLSVHIDMILARYGRPRLNNIIIIIISFFFLSHDDVFSSVSTRNTFQLKPDNRFVII